MAMNREFLEALYAKHGQVARHLGELAGRDTFCAEACTDCGRTINSDEPMHSAALAEVQNEIITLNSLLDLYWHTHNGGER